MNDNKNTLIPKEPQDIEIMEDTLMTYKVYTKNLYCPARVSIRYNDGVSTQAGAGGGVRIGDLKIYCSLDSKEPDDHDYYK